MQAGRRAAEAEKMDFYLPRIFFLVQKKESVNDFWPVILFFHPHSKSHLQIRFGASYN